MVLVKHALEAVNLLYGWGVKKADYALDWLWSATKKWKPVSKIEVERDLTQKIQPNEPANHQ
jgi:hypothetical protein